MSGANEHAVLNRAVRASAKLLCGVSFFALAQLALSTAASAQANLTWGANGGTGGTGTWDTATPNWFNGASFVPWTNGTFDNAIFGGTAGTVTTSGSIDVHNIAFNTTGYALSGGTLNLGGATPTITTNAGVSATISSVLTGTAGLTTAGAGTVTLSGVNTFSGTINVTAGTLSITRDAALGNASNGVTMAAGTQLTLTVPSLLAASRVITLTGGSVTLSGRVGAARFTGAGGIIAQANVNLTNNANDYTGQTQFVAAGTNSFSSIANLGVASALGAPTTAANGTVLASVTAGGMVLAYTGTGGSSNRDFSLQDNGGLVTLRNAGSGALTLTGSIALGGSGASFSNIFFNAATGDLTLPGVISETTSRDVTFSGSAGRTISLGGANIWSGGTTISGGVKVLVPVFVNHGVVSSIGTASSFNIADDVNFTTGGGILSYTGAATSSDRGFLFITGNGTVSNDGSGAMTLSGTMSLLSSNSTATLAGSFSGAANSASGVISGPGGLTANTAGTWSLSGTNTYTGATTITAGTLQAGAAAGGQAFGNLSAVTLANAAGATLDLNGFNQTIGSLAGGGATGGNVTLGSATLSTGGNNTSTTFAGVISGGGGLTMTGSGVQTLSGVNTYTGATTVNAGTLQAGAAAGGQAFGNLSAVTLANVAGATLDLNGFSQTIGSLAGGGATGGNVALGAGTLSTGGNNASTTFAGVISGSGGLIMTGSGVQTLSGVNTYTGATTINAGTLQAGVAAGGQAFGNLSAVTLANAAGATLDLNGFGQTIGSLAGGGASGGNVTLGAGTLTTGGNNTSATFAGVISGSGGLTKAGTGVQSLTGSNSYTGVTTVAGGTLRVNGDQSAATGATGVASGATLGGAGIIGGDVAVAGGGTLAPGNSPGTLTINGNLALADSSLLAYEFGQSNVVGGPLNDLTQVGGNLVLDGTINVTVSPGGSFAAGLYRIINYGGTLTDNGLTLGTLPAGSTAFVQTSIANQVNLVNTTGVTLNFWDGAAGPKNNGVVNGGNGVWQSGAGNDNWTDVSGAFNAPYSNGAFAIFSAAPGAVIIDNGPGNVTAVGMQFASSGYVITGNALTLVGPQSIIRVGDGTAAGAGYTATIGAVLTGTAQLVKTDLGTLVLSGTNSYTGGTLIDAGTLRISSDANLGTAAGGLGFDGGTLNTTASFASARNVALIGAGTLLTDAGTTLTLNGPISGTGALTKAGAGTTILTGANTYSGGTTITAGTLVGSATSFDTGAISDNAALVIDQPADAAFANAINGTGSFTKRGAGRLNYIGTGSLSGPTTVAAGLLSVNGSLAQSAVTVQNGGTLGGNGTVGATIIQSGGTVAPGNSIGTLHVNGAFTQASGSIYQVEVDPNSNASDRILVSGAATLQSGAGLNVTQSVPGNYQVGTVYTVLTASGGLSGSYTVTGQTSSVSAFLGLKDSYDANNAYLTVVQTRDLVQAAQTSNQQAVATAINTLPPTNPVSTAVLNLPDDTAARSAFDQLSATAQASAKSVLISNGLYVRDVTFDRLRDVLCALEDQTGVAPVGCVSDRQMFWAQGFGGWGSIDGNANAVGLGHSTAGVLVGVDVPVADWLIGVFGGASHSDFHLVNDSASGHSVDYHLGVYGGTQWDDLVLRLGASYSWDDLTTDRAVTVGSFTDRLRAVYQGGTTQAIADLGYRLELRDIRFEPFANLAYEGLRTPAFSEVGGPAALSVRADTIEDAVTTFGMRPSSDVSWEGSRVTLRGMVGWRHTFGVVTPTATAAFTDSSAFTVSGAPIARDAAVLEAGVDFGLYDNVTAELTYGGQFSNRTTEQIARGTIRISL